MKRFFSLWALGLGIFSLAFIWSLRRSADQILAQKTPVQESPSPFKAQDLRQPAADDFSGNTENTGIPRPGSKESPPKATKIPSR